ncbi:hypothetical protein EXN66_Car003716 [Channa argus]|uniref:Uncharacterized protein n=1 Tax=Channa argus TaxID=215402 RepID=A0A6G1PD45_CHAAH|nr:hypothetical protein EXN66_Car003716 [Channa argus]
MEHTIITWQWTQSQVPCVVWKKLICIQTHQASSLNISAASHYCFYGGGCYNYRLKPIWFDSCSIYFWPSASRFDEDDMV